MLGVGLAYGEYPSWKETKRYRNMYTTNETPKSVLEEVEPGLPG